MCPTEKLERLDDPDKTCQTKDQRRVSIDLIYHRQAWRQVTLLENKYLYIITAL